MKRTVSLLCILLFIVSIYNDLQKTSMVTEPAMDSSEVFHRKEVATLYYIKVVAQPGDTMLTLVERVNGNILNEKQIEEVQEDFEILNGSFTTISPKKTYKVPFYINKKGLQQGNP